MKRTTLVLTSILVSSLTLLFPQLKVAENGNVNIQATGIPLSPLTVGGIGSSSDFVSITTPGTYDMGLNVHHPGTPLLTSCTAIRGNTNPFPGKSFGVLGQSYSNNMAYMPSYAYGVMGVAGNCMYGNYGVYGVLQGTASGAGVIGTIDNVQSLRFDGIYAGYFYGNVRVTGTINGVNVISSDIRYKKNVEEINARKALTNILKMNPVEYDLKEEAIELTRSEDTLSEVSENIQSVIYRKKHFGLIAQELQELYPDLVYEQDNGYLAINYTGLIPVLIQSIKELNEKVEQLSALSVQPVSQLAGENLKNVTHIEAVSFGVAALYQNTPNPFSEITNIRYYLPADVQTAYLCIYDLQGKQLKKITVSQREEGLEAISGAEFPAGIYLYALLADGVEVDVKRMILTE
ncbi:MAG: tail fiber domain-containing protein [Candidatus Azobacteroides sp.]|nr:tail fiber domain-containing protein [Candidatus Azobacteroides sp.]